MMIMVGQLTYFLAKVDHRNLILHLILLVVFSNIACLTISIQNLFGSARHVHHQKKDEILHLQQKFSIMVSRQLIVAANRMHAHFLNLYLTSILSYLEECISLAYS